MSCKDGLIFRDVVQCPAVTFCRYWHPWLQCIYFTESGGELSRTDPFRRWAGTRGLALRKKKNRTQSKHVSLSWYSKQFEVVTWRNELEPLTDFFKGSPFPFFGPPFFLRPNGTSHPESGLALGTERVATDNIAGGKLTSVSFTYRKEPESRGYKTQHSCMCSCKVTPSSFSLYWIFFSYLFLKQRQNAEWSCRLLSSGECFPSLPVKVSVSICREAEVD